MAAEGQISLMEAALRLGVDYHVARRWMLTRLLKAERINGHWYVDAQDLERLCGQQGLDSPDSGLLLKRLRSNPKKNPATK